MPKTDSSSCDIQHDYNNTSSKQLSNFDSMEFKTVFG